MNGESVQGFLINGLMIFLNAEKMNLVFFQSCISPHQIPYIKELCYDKRVNSVCLVVPRSDYKQRVDMGWNSRHLLDGSRVRLFILPLDEVVEGLFTRKDVYAIFSGIRADKDVFRWLKLSLRFEVKRGIITEAPNIYFYKPLFLHRLRFLMQDYRFVNSIDYVYTFGSVATKYYGLWSKRWKVVPFSYCTETGRALNHISVSQSPKLLYVGSINKNKNVSSVLKVMAVNNSCLVDFHIIGDGPERKRLEQYVDNKQLDKVVFHGAMEMWQVHSIMPEFDILVLPSRYDGWGAVINEALQCGLYVLCSDKCGAKDLLVNDKLGSVFHGRKELENCLSEAVENISFIRQGCIYRKSWAETISGKSLAKYFVDNLLTSEYIVEPWKVF